MVCDNCSVIKFSGKVMVMGYNQWGEILGAVNEEEGLSKDNVIERIKEKLKVKDEDEYQKWEKAGFSVNHLFQLTFCRKAEEYTLLHLAARENHTRIVTTLIEKEANVNAIGKDRLTPLHLAAIYGRTKAEIVEVLLQAKEIDINAASENGHTPLCYAALQGHTEIVEVLLQAEGIDINAADKWEQTPLHSAIQRGHTEVVKVLLQAERIDINAADKNGHTPLCYAALRGHTEIVKVLLQAERIDINAADKREQTPLHLAIQQGHTKIVTILIAEGAKVDEKFDIGKCKGLTPLKETQQRALNRSVLAGSATAVLGAAIAIALFAAGTIAVELIPIVIAVATVAIATLAVGGITYMMSKPSTKVEEAKKEKTAGNEQKVPT